MNKTTENRLGGELRSHQAARRLLEELRRGRYADAAQLPSELELADVLGVSRTVVRDALSDLERDGYLERVRGIGTLVNRDVVRVENRMGDFTCRKHWKCSYSVLPPISRWNTAPTPIFSNSALTSSSV